MQLFRHRRSMCLMVLAFCMTSLAQSQPTALQESAPSPTRAATNRVALGVGISLGIFAVALVVLAIVFRLSSRDSPDLRVADLRASNAETADEQVSTPTMAVTVAPMATTATAEWQGDGENSMQHVAVSIPEEQPVFAATEPPHDDLRPNHSPEQPTSPTFPTFESSDSCLRAEWQLRIISASSILGPCPSPVPPVDSMGAEHGKRLSLRRNPSSSNPSTFSSSMWITESAPSSWGPSEADDRYASTLTESQAGLDRPSSLSPAIVALPDTDAILPVQERNSPRVPPLSDLSFLRCDVPVPQDGSISPSGMMTNDELFSHGTHQRLKLLGRGTSGSVYAVLLANGSTVAMKETLLPHDGFAERLAEVQREISVMSQLDHPSVVKYYHSTVDMEDLKVSIFMELVPGGSLTRMVRDLDTPISERVLRKYIRQATSGLAFMHSKGIAHRDLKGDNLLLSGDGKIKIADFGTARALGPNAVAQTIVGTPLFMAPEMIMGLTAEETDDDHGYSTKADIWSLGITVCELANRGAAPWPDFANPAQAFNYIANSASLPSVPDHLTDTAKDFIRQCCTRDPARRPTAQELLSHPWIRKRGAQPFDADNFAGSLNSSTASF